MSSFFDRLEAYCNNETKLYGLSPALIDLTHTWNLEGSRASRAFRSSEPLDAGPGLSPVRLYDTDELHRLSNGGRTFNTHHGLITLHAEGRVILMNDFPALRTFLEEEGFRAGKGNDGSEITGCLHTTEPLRPIKPGTPFSKDWEGMNKLRDIQRYQAAQGLDWQKAKISPAPSSGRPGTKRALIVVDPYRNFYDNSCEPNSTYAQEAAPAAAQLKHLLGQVRATPGQYDQIIFVYYGSMDATLENAGRGIYDGQMLPTGKHYIPEPGIDPEFVPQANERFLFKSDKSAVKNTDLLAFLQRHHITQTDVAGFETSACVAMTANDLAAEGYKVRVVRDCTASRIPGRTQDGLDEMAKAGVVEVDAEQCLKPRFTFSAMVREERPTPLAPGGMQRC